MTKAAFSPVSARDTRGRLLDTAEQLFSRQGFARTSVRQIADGANANLGAVNYYFRSKQNLYAEVFARLASRIRDPVLEAAREAGETVPRAPEEAFLILGRAFLESHRDPADAQSLMALIAREFVDRCLPPRLLAEEYFSPTLDVITTVVRRARPDLPSASATVCARAFFAQLMHIVKSRGGRMSVDVMLEDAVRFTVAGVLHMDAVFPRRSPRHIRQKS